MTDKIFNFLINYFSNINDRGVDEMNNFRGDITSDEIIEWLKNIQNTSSEQPSEDLDKATKEYIKEDCILPEGCNDGDITYYEGYTALAFKAGAYWQKKQIIDKACKWLRRCINVDDKVKMIDGEPEAKSFIQKNLHRIEVTNQIIADFKKAMEDE
jgi:hypothetical protein